jgi:hypothetical protein
MQLPHQEQESTGAISRKEGNTEWGKKKVVEGVNKIKEHPMNT